MILKESTASSSNKARQVWEEFILRRSRRRWKLKRKKIGGKSRRILSRNQQFED